MKFEKELLETASRLAQQASQKVMELLKGPISQGRKEDHTIVTEADLRSDEIIRGGLSKAFPDHAILSEEDGLSGNPDSEWTWLIDPLDGTKAYAKGIAEFSIMVGLLKKKTPYLGVVVDPLGGLVYEAVKGEGAWIQSKGDRRRVHVSERREFSRMPLVVSTGCPSDPLEKTRTLLKGPVLPPINSVGIKVGLLVRSQADIYISHHPVHLWDTCAPQVILEEAGGQLTALDGSPLIYAPAKKQSHDVLILGSNGTRHADLARLIAPIF